MASGVRSPSSGGVALAFLEDLKGRLDYGAMQVPATYWALGIGALAAIILFFLLRKAVMRLGRAGEELRDV